MSISVVIPAYNEASRLTESLPKLLTALRPWPSAEIVIIDDGSTDSTAHVARSMLAGRNHHVVALPWNQGKGAALKAGVATARGDEIVVMDADLAGDLGDMERLLDNLTTHHIAVGSRHAAGSQVEYASATRPLMSRCFGSFVRAVTGIAVNDTQCGFKAFRAPVAKILFHLSETDGFAMDVELMVLAKILEYDVVEVPIRWKERPGSTVRLVHDPVFMALDVVRTQIRLAARNKRLVESRRRSSGVLGLNPDDARRSSSWATSGHVTLAAGDC